MRGSYILGGITCDVNVCVFYKSKNGFPTVLTSHSILTLYNTFTLLPVTRIGPPWSLLQDLHPVGLDSVLSVFLVVPGLSP